MIKRILNIKTIALVLVTVNASYAANMSGSVSFTRSSTDYGRCQHIADAINNMQELYANPEDNNKDYLLHEIHKKKKKLKECEKKAESEARKRRFIPTTYQVGVTIPLGGK
jgi:hypothetical protein